MSQSVRTRAASKRRVNNKNMFSMSEGRTVLRCSTYDSAVRKKSLIRVRTADTTDTRVLLVLSTAHRIISDRVSAA